MRLISPLLALVAVAAAGCAGSAALERKVSELSRQVDQVRRENSRAGKKLDEIDNRVFVLEDKVDTQDVALGRAGDGEPDLPVVKKQAPPQQKPKAQAQPQGGTVAEEYVDESGEHVLVIYEGDAAKTPDKRPKLTLHENGGDDGDDDGVAPAARAAPKVRRGKEPTPVAVAAPDGAHDTIPVQKKVPPAPAAPGAEDPLSLYKASYQALGRREHQTAIAGFLRFLELFPAHDYADNAQYWLAEAYYDQRDYQTALTEFRKVVKRYPGGNKAPDALLKIGYCYAKLGDLESATDVLAQVVEIYPKTEAARLAAKRLEEMRSK